MTGPGVSTIFEAVFLAYRPSLTQAGGVAGRLCKQEVAGSIPAGSTAKDLQSTYSWRRCERSPGCVPQVCSLRGPEAFTEHSARVSDQPYQRAVRCGLQARLSGSLADETAAPLHAWLVAVVAAVVPVRGCG